MLLIQDLTKQDRELLENIMRKEKAALTDNEKAVLKARRDYISKEVYKELIDDEPKKAQKVEDKKQSTADPFSVSEKK